MFWLIIRRKFTFTYHLSDYSRLLFNWKRRTSKLKEENYTESTISILVRVVSISMKRPTTVKFNAPSTAILKKKICENSFKEHILFTEYILEYLISVYIYIKSKLVHYMY